MIAVDLYTQKSPTDGKGTDQPGGSFAPLEGIQLYAHVTYDSRVVAGVFVAFQVTGPTNASNPHAVFRSAQTDKNGMAAISFYLPPTANETNGIFGEWEAYASAQILGETGQDTLAFEVTRGEAKPEAAISAFVLNSFVLLLVFTGTLTFTLLFRLRRQRQA